MEKERKRVEEILIESIPQCNFTNDLRKQFLERSTCLSVMSVWVG